MPKWPLGTRGQGQEGPHFAPSRDVENIMFIGLQHFDNVDTLQMKCFEHMLLSLTHYANFCCTFIEILAF